MIGQTQLFEQAAVFQKINEFPKVNLIIGPVGSGRHTFVKELAQKFQVPCEPLEDPYASSQLKFYYLNLQELLFREQSDLISLVENPPITGWLFFLVEHEDLVTSNLLSKCWVWRMLPYSSDQLNIFLPQGVPIEALQIVRTPGQAQKVTSSQYLVELNKLCTMIVEKLKLANFANALTIVNQLACKGEEDKFDINLFFNCMLLKTINLPKLYLITLDYQKKFRYKKLNMQSLMESYIIDLWEVVK